jgi:biotin transport system substrate-specific component
MLRTLPQTRSLSLVYQVAIIAAFTLLTIVAARITIPFIPVPFTMQTFAVLLAGMVLGSRAGALSQLAYLGLIMVGLPVDARGLGAAAFFGPTGGFLVGFVVAAFVVGLLVERSGERRWVRWVAGLVGAVIIYAFGIPVLAAVTGQTLIAAGAVLGNLVVPDILKSFLAASLTEGARGWLLRR